MALSASSAHSNLQRSWRRLLLRVGALSPTGSRLFSRAWKTFTSHSCDRQREISMTTPEVIGGSRAAARRAPPARRRSIIAVGFSRIIYGILGYFRSPDTVFFTFLFPIIMLGVLTAAFSSAGNVNPVPGGPSVSVGATYLPGMVAAGMLLSGMQGLAIEIAMEKSGGTLKRLGGSPLSPVSYFIGKFGCVFVTGLIQLTALLLFAWAVLRIDLPTSPEAWLTIAWMFALGIGCGAFVGIALSSVPRSGKSATAVVIPVMLLLQFFSGVYLQFHVLPTWMQNISSVFPLKWMAQGMRAAFLPDGFKVMEQDGVWNLGWVAVWLAVWLVGGIILSRLTFRWLRRDT